MQQQKRGALKRGAPAETHQVFVDQLFLTGGEPGEIEGQRRKVGVEIPQLAAREYAQHQRRQRLDRVLHLAHQRALQADHVGRQRVVEDLPAAIVQHFVAEGPAAQHGIEMLAADALAQEAGAGIDVQLVDLELLDEIQFFGGERAQRRPLAQRAILTRCVRAGRPRIAQYH